MLHETKQRELTKYGAQETVRFKIAETDKSFGILFDNLYSDGISSIIRELWSNAYDSHIEAGITDRPFYCHIPTSFEPEFRVRDYGVSMPHSVVMGIYATMFGSTKDKDNVAVGKFGLGSKSPFAYIDTFTVTAIMDGEKRLYSAYLDAEGRPAISHMHTEPTDEATGVEISFPVDPKDVSEFRNKAVDVARAFSVRPSTNDDEIFNKINSIVPLFEGTNWTAYTASDVYSVRSKAMIRQGCVAYPVDPDEVFDRYNLTTEERGLLNLLETNLVIDVPIGSVEITPSRENLKYTDKTKDTIRTALAMVDTEWRAHLEKKLAEAPSYNAACALYNEMRGNYDPLRLRDKKLMYKGRPLRSNLLLDGYGKSALGRTGLRALTVTTSEFKNGKSYRSKGWNGRFVSETSNVSPGTTVFFVEDPLKEKVKRVADRIRIAYKDMLDDPDTPNPTHFVWVKASPSSRAFKRMLVAVGRPDASAFVMVDELPEPPKVASFAGTATRTPVKCKLVNPNTGRIEETEVDAEEEDVIYVRKTRNDYNDFGSYASDNSIKDWVKQLYAAGRIEADTKVIIVPASKKSLIKKNEGVWRNLSDVINMFLDEISIQSLEAKKHLESIGHTHRDMSRFLEAMARSGSSLQKRTELYDAIRRVRVLQRLSARAALTPETMEMFRALRPKAYEDVFDKTSPAMEKFLSTEWYRATCKDAARNYPLLGATVRSNFITSNDELMHHLRRYIDMVDSAE